MLVTMTRVTKVAPRALCPMVPGTYCQGTDVCANCGALIPQDETVEVLVDADTLEEVVSGDKVTVQITGKEYPGTFYGLSAYQEPFDTIYSVSLDIGAVVDAYDTMLRKA